MIPFLTTLFAWTFQSFTGFGAGIFIVGFLSLFYDPKEVIVSSAIANLAGTLLILFQNKKGSLNMLILSVLILSSVPGIYIGSHLLSVMDRHSLKVVIAVFIILLGLYDYLVQKGVLNLKLNRSFGPFVGFLGGLSAGLVGLGGPPPAVYLNQNADSKESFKLMLNVYFTSNILLRLLFYQKQDALYLNREIITYCMLAVPLGVWVGGILSQKFTNKDFKRVVPLSIILLGVFVLVV